MLTLNTGRRGDIGASLQRPGHATGGWEIRLRSHRYSTHAADYTVRTELIPAGRRPLHCGSRNVALEQYRLGHRRANFYIRNRPARQYVAHQRLDSATTNGTPSAWRSRTGGPPASSTLT